MLNKFEIGDIAISKKNVEFSNGTKHRIGDLIYVTKYNLDYFNMNPLEYFRAKIEKESSETKKIKNIVFKLSTSTSIDKQPTISVDMIITDFNVIYDDGTTLKIPDDALGYDDVPYVDMWDGCEISKSEIDEISSLLNEKILESVEKIETEISNISVLGFISSDL